MYDSVLKTGERNERWHVPWRRRVGRMETVGLAPAGLGLNPRRTQGRPRLLHGPDILVLVPLWVKPLAKEISRDRERRRGASCISQIVPLVTFVLPAWLMY